MGNNTTIMLRGDILFINQVELVTPTTVAGTLYGIGFTLFCLYVHLLVLRLRVDDRRRQSKFMLSYSAIIMLCGLYHLVANAWVNQDAYIKHGNTPGGPYSYVVASIHSPIIITSFIAQMLVDILTSAIQIWRVWVIWTATRYAKLVIVLPSLCFLTFIALNLRSLILETTVSPSQALQLDRKIYTATSAVQGATTIVCTALISVFLVFEQWRQRKLMGEVHGSVSYMKIVTMLIESYMLESVWVLTAVVLTHPVNFFFVGTTTYIEIIAYLLVQYRVASGKAHESQRERSRISTLNWNHSNVAEMEFRERNNDDDDHGITTKPHPSKMLPVAAIV